MRALLSVSDREGIVELARGLVDAGIECFATEGTREHLAENGIETPTYDALGRTTRVTHPDATYSQTLYGAAVSGTGVQTAQLCSSITYGLGFPVVAIDEAGKRREFWDGAGLRF